MYKSSIAHRLSETKLLRVKLFIFIFLVLKFILSAEKKNYLIEMVFKYP